MPLEYPVWTVSACSCDLEFCLLNGVSAGKLGEFGQGGGQGEHTASLTASLASSPTVR